MNIQAAVKGSDQTAQAGLSLSVARITLLEISCHSWERSGSMEETLTQDRGATGKSLTGVTALCP